MTSERRNAVRDSWLGEQAWHVRVRPTRRQWIYLTLCALAALASASVVVGVDHPGGDRSIGIGAGAVALAFYLLGIGYAIFLRSRMDCLVVDASHVRLGTQAFRQVGAKLALRPWIRLGHSGVVAVLDNGKQPLAIAVRRTLVAPLGARPWKGAIAAELGCGDAEAFLLSLGLPEGSFVLGPVPPPKTKKTGPMHQLLPWLATIVCLAIVGPLVGPLLASTPGGRIALLTITMLIIGVGLVFTATGSMLASNPVSRTFRSADQAQATMGRESGEALPSLPPARSFWQAAGRVVGWQVGAVLLAAVGLWPMFAIPSAFERWVDIPQCQSLCEKEEGRFIAYACAKSSGCTCACEAKGQLNQHRVSFTVTGGDSWSAHLFNWLLRTLTTVGGLGIWVFGVSLVFGWGFVKRRRRGLQDTTHDPVT